MARGWRDRWYEVIFEADTPAGKLFDVVLLVAIFLSVLTVTLESVAGIRARHAGTLIAVEWIFTILFTIEYVAATGCAYRTGPLHYARSFFGIVDLRSDPA